MKARVASIAVAACVAAGCCKQSLRQSATAAPLLLTSEGRHASPPAPVLAKRITCDFVNKSISEIVDSISRQSNIRLLILSEQGGQVDASPVIDIHQNESPVSDVLDALMESIHRSQATSFGDCDWWWENGVVMIGPLNRVPVYTTVYELEPVLVAVRTRWVSTARFFPAFSAKRTPYGFIESASSSGAKARNDMPATAETQNECVDALVDMIKTSIEPASWKEAGGLHGTVQPIGTKLVVTSTARVQQKISSFLGLFQ